MEGNFSWRHALALLVTLTSAWAIWNGTHLVLTEPDRFAHTPLMHVSLATPPAPPAPPKIVPKPPKPVMQKQVASRTPIETSPHAIGPPVANNAPVISQNATPTPPAPAGPAENISLESTYIAGFRAAVEAEKRYPMSKDARLQQPTGTVRLMATLDRSGNLIDVVVAQSAGSILDRAALEAVRRSNFAPFPADIWPGQERHAIQIELYFHT